MLIKRIKKIINTVLESSLRINNLKNKFLNTTKSVLILGDGISSIYTQSYLNNYDYIITSNLSLLNQNLKKYPLTYYVIMEPDFLTKKQRTQTLLWQAIRKNFDNFENNIPIMHPIGRLVNFGRWSDTSPIFISPYHKFKLKNGEYYNNFTASFQACLGMALLSGFKNIDCAGFDSWLLNPPNSLRWFSKSSNPELSDRQNKSANEIPNFLKIALNNANINVYNYRHYRSRYIEIKNLYTGNNSFYIPERDRKNYMTNDDLRVWEEFENINHPYGYEVKKR